MALEKRRLIKAFFAHPLRAMLYIIEETLKEEVGRMGQKIFEDVKERLERSGF